MTARTLRALGREHAVEVLSELRMAKARFNWLKERAAKGTPETLPEISSKTLSGLLRELRLCGLVERHERSRQEVFYNITPLGLRMLKHAEEIANAR